MARHLGALICAGSRTVRGRDGTAHPVQRLEVAGTTLYYARQFTHHPRLRRLERWLLPEQGWMVARFTPLPDAPPLDWQWYVDFDRITVAGDCWLAEDRYLDAIIHEGRGYEIVDADELADGIEQGEITLVEAIDALRSLDTFCRVIPGLGFSGAALLRQYAPGLPE